MTLLSVASCSAGDSSDFGVTPTGEQDIDFSGGGCPLQEVIFSLSHTDSISHASARNFCVVVSFRMWAHLVVGTRSWLHCTCMTPELGKGVVSSDS